MAVVTVSIAQSGSGSATLHVQRGDTVTLKVLNVNHAAQIAEAGAHLQLLSAITGVTFAIDATGGAS